MTGLWKYTLGDEVLVPSSLLPRPEAAAFALTRTRVTGHVDRSIRIDIQDDNSNDIVVASRNALPGDTRIFVVRVGDFRSELTLLRPIHRNVLSFLDLLIAPDMIDHDHIRTLDELAHVWEQRGSGASHVVIVGHGAADGLLHLGGKISAAELAALLDEAAPGATPKTFISLACLTGRAEFAKPFSTARVCREYVGPFQSINGAAAAQFGVSLMARHFLAGDGLLAAFRRANELADRSHFRLWRAGKLARAAP